LRTLKLTGMLDTLDARVAQARTGALGHLDFLQVLCEDEIARRESAALTRRLRLARFEEQTTIESFDFTANPKVPAAVLRDLAALRLGRRSRNELSPHPRPRRSTRMCGEQRRQTTLLGGVGRKGP